VRILTKWNSCGGLLPDEYGLVGRLDWPPSRREDTYLIGPGRLVGQEAQLHQTTNATLICAWTQLLTVFGEFLWRDRDAVSDAAEFVFLVPSLAADDDPFDHIEDFDFGRPQLLNGKARYCCDRSPGIDFEASFE